MQNTWDPLPLNFLVSHAIDSMRFWLIVTFVVVVDAATAVAVVVIIFI